MKKLIYTIFIVVLLILANVCTVFADSGVSNVNITFIVLTCILAPALVGVIVYYALKAKKVKNSNADEKDIKIIRDYDDK